MTRPSARPHRARRLAVVLPLLVVLTAGCASAGAQPAPEPPAPPPGAQAALEEGESNPMIAEGVTLPPGVTVYKSSGLGPDALNAAAPEDTPESFVDMTMFGDDGPPAGMTVTEAQGLNVLARIRENLEARGLRPEDVTTMRVFLDAPPGEPRADYAGWNRAYRQYFANTDLVTGETVEVPTGTGEPAPPLLRNPTRPSRFALEVASLPVPGWLVEVEVDAVYPPGVEPR